MGRLAADTQPSSTISVPSEVSRSDVTADPKG
jgi:hypothetical protein